VSLWVRQRLAVTAVTMVFAQSAGHLDGSSAAGAAIVANIFGALVLCATALRLLRRAMYEHQEQVVRLRSELAETEVAVHEQRDLLHELGSTLAGIASASEIIRHGYALPAPRRRRLEGMLEAEVARLVRLLSDRVTPAGNAAIDLDEVLGTIVLSHQTRGTDVRWSPGGLIAAGRADDLAEVVNILLDNTARHAAGTQVTLTVTASDGLVEIACSDLGPGLAAEVAARLFQSGARGPASPGQGLGLSIAKRLMDEQGGSLDLRPSAAGTTFVVRLPELVPDKEMTHVVAHAS
jgi:signal transduction histidine kinase